MEDTPKTLLISREDPCGCGSGIPIKDCCLVGDQLKVKHRELEMLYSSTGKLVQKCYFSDHPSSVRRNTCGGKLSGEHIISEAILKQFSTAGRIGFSGTNFKGEKYSFEKGIYTDNKNLKSKCLCEKHNLALSPLDKEASRFFKAFGEIHESFEKGIFAQKIYLFSGFDIERWFLKTLMALYFSRKSNISPEQYSLPSYILNFFDSPFYPPYGLYVKVKDKKGYGLPSKLMPTAHPALITCGDLVCGISVVFRDFDMKLMIAGTGLEFDHLHLKSTHVFRPRFINFFRDEDVFGIGFAWTNLGENGGQSMWLSRGTKATPPCLIESPE